MSNVCAGECVFPEEMEPSGRLILGPCLGCGLPAIEAIGKARRLAGIVMNLTEVKYDDPTGRLQRLVTHGLSECISAHGPITRNLLPSAAKRIARNIAYSIRDSLDNA